MREEKSFTKSKMAVFAFLILILLILSLLFMFLFYKVIWKMIVDVIIYFIEVFIPEHGKQIRHKLWFIVLLISRYLLEKL